VSNEIIKAVAIIIIAAVLVTALRTRLSEYSFLLTLTVIAIVLIAVLGNLFGAVSKLRELFNQSGNAGVYFVTALKALGISYIATFAADTHFVNVALVVPVINPIAPPTWVLLELTSPPK